MEFCNLIPCPAPKLVCAMFSNAAGFPIPIPTLPFASTVMSVDAEVPTVKVPTLALCEKRLVELAVVAKNDVVVPAVKEKFKPVVCPVCDMEKSVVVEVPPVVDAMVKSGVLAAVVAEFEIESMAQGEVVPMPVHPLLLTVN